MTMVRSFFAVLLAHLAAVPVASAQRDGGAVFVVRIGADTLAVERASIAASRAEGTLRLRTPPTLVRQLVELDPAGVVSRVATTAGRGARGDSAIKRLEVTIAGDSGTAQPFDAAAPAPLPAQRIAVPRGAVPYVNLSGLSLELMLRRARAIAVHRGGGRRRHAGRTSPRRHADASRGACRRETARRRAHHRLGCAGS